MAFIKQGVLRHTQTLTFDNLNLHPLSQINFSGFLTLLSFTGDEGKLGGREK